VLTLNPLYSGPKPHVGTVIYQFKSDIMDDLSDLKSGAAQMMYTVPFNLLPDIQNSTGVHLESGGLSLDILYLSLNTQKPPLDNVLVRQAINWAIDRQSIINNIIHGYGATFQGPLPRGMFAYNDSIQGYGYNLTMAQQLLTAAGYPGGKGIRPLSLIYLTGDPVAAAVMQAVASDLSQIGITVNLQAVTQTTYFSIAATVPRVSNYPDIFQDEWFPDYAYPDDYAYAFENVNSVFDNPNYNDTQLNTLTQAAISTGNTTLQQELYSRITEREKALAGYIWLYQDVIGDGVPAYLTTVQNVTWNPIQYGFKFAPLYIAPAASGAAGITQGSFWLLAATTIAPTKLTVATKP
jgi:peptide/nickel transport system substrate-binding protein